MQWQLVQRSHNRLKGGHETSKHWVSQLIQRLWEISWDMWEARNGEIHLNAKVRRELYSGGIMAKVEALKIQAGFSLCLSREEKEFFQTPSDVIEGKRERSQLNWIARAEQFLASDRISMRLTTPRGNMYRWLAGGPRGQQSRPQPRITDHMTVLQDDPASRSPQRIQEPAALTTPRHQQIQQRQTQLDSFLQRNNKRQRIDGKTKNTKEK